ncbi:MAG: FecR domain-containing protein [Thermoanaerobaculia bacterium]|nr:FecR domain-containing protein [Thermoanaerobaculia bacterium]
MKTKELKTTDTMKNSGKLESAETILQRATEELCRQADALDPAVEDAAVARAWTEVSQAVGDLDSVEAEESANRILDCAALQSLLPAYRAGDLKPERALLVEDHARSCVPCRRALRGSVLDPMGDVDASDERAASAPRRNLWAWAAACILALGIASTLYFGSFAGPQEGSFELVSGALFASQGDLVGPVALGATVAYGQEVITPRGERAVVELADGSRVELKERSRMHVEARRGSTTIDLAAGNIVVEAADQKDGRLYVATDDCLVAVKGTVFSVNHGTRGSRVAVFEGEVEVNEGGRDHKLNPGDQISTRPGLGTVALAEEIAWSGNAEKHLALLRELSSLNLELRTQPRPGLRYESALLDMLPAETGAYLALPNLSSSIRETVELLEARLQSSGVLTNWAGPSGSLDDLREAIERVAPLGERLGEELVVAGWWRGEDFVGPALLAETGQSDSLRADLRAELDRLADHDLVLVDDPYASDLPERGLLIFVAEHGVVAAPGAQALRELVDAARGVTNNFVGTTFHQRLSERYSAGVESIAAVDFEPWGERADADAREHLAALGFDGARDLILEQRGEGDRTHRQAVLSFAGERTGVASWLAEPAPMLSLSYMSPDTTLVAATLIEDPSRLFADLLASLTADEVQEIEEDLSNFEAEHGWDPREDFIASLGGEVALALDGPLAPTPSWKLVIEVFDPSRLQQGIERFVADANDRLREEGKPTVELVEAAAGSWIVRGQSDLGLTHEAHYAFIDGYMVATPSAALLDRARRYHDTGFNLLSGDRISALLPADGRMNYSALWYQNLSDLLEPLGALLSGSSIGGELPIEVREELAAIGEEMGPSLVYAVGGDTEITLSATSTRNPLGLLQLLAVRDLLDAL